MESHEEKLNKIMKGFKSVPLPEFDGVFYTYLKYFSTYQD